MVCPVSLKEKFRRTVTNKYYFKMRYQEYIARQMTVRPARNHRSSRYGIEVAVKYLTDILPQESRIVDIGCGDGYALDVFRAYGISKTLGVDINHSKLVTAKEFENKVVEGDIHFLPIRSNTMMGIHCNHVLEHVLRADLFLKECARLLQPSGKAVFVVPIGSGSLKHPTAFLEPGDLERLISPHLNVLHIFEGHTREREFWAICSKGVETEVVSRIKLLHQITQNSECAE